MIVRTSVVATLAAVAAACFAVPALAAEKKELKPTNKWSGSVADAKLQQTAPAVIVSKKGLEKVWKDWGISDKMPDVDFTKEIVVVVTSPGSKLNLSAVRLDEKGNLEALGMGTLDLGEGFRYVLATVPRDGVKTVGGKDLPKE